MSANAVQAEEDDEDRWADIPPEEAKRMGEEKQELQAREL